MTASKSYGFKALAAAALLAATAAPATVLAQEHHMSSEGEAQPDAYSDQGSIFKCEDGRDLTVQFQTQKAGFYAIVDSGAGPHALLLKPWRNGDEPQITWSDGVRTLTWSAGVQLMLMDNGTHLMCGRAAHDHMH